ncbi:MAG: hypothetical protein HUJ94_08535 [Bacteroidales bacterium]|nr:hypothetical protein [Bacteroidales bacterium]
MLQQDTLTSLSILSATVFISVSVCCAYIRWHHMCRPYDDNWRRYYPSRRRMTVFYLLSLSCIPYIIHPDSPDTWLFTESCLLVYPSISVVLCMSPYFDLNMLTTRKKRLFFYCPPYTLLILMLPFALTGGDNLAAVKPYVQLVIFVYGVLLTLVSFRSISRLYKVTNDYLLDNYSNDSDSPFRNSGMALNCTFMIVVLFWLIFLFDWKWLLTVAFIFSAAISLEMLKRILHPSIPLEESKREEEVADDMVIYNESGKVELAREQDLYEKITNYMNETKPFLDSHFNLADLSTAVGSNRTYVSQVCKKRLGGFYNYINKCRIEYAREFQKNNPGASQDDIAIASGFNYRQTYQRVLKNTKD